MKVKGIKKRYKVGGGTVTALDGISFDLPQKGMVFILGKSGCGKSTLLNVMSGLDKADEGSIEVDGKDITKLADSEISKYRNSCCGFIFQEYNLIPELNVSENIKLSLDLQDKRNTVEKVKEVLKQVGLEEYENRKVTELSGGQKQRISIARAIVKDPKIIFADEPTGALDEKTGESIFKLLKGFSSDKLVIVVTHDREFASEYGDRIIELADGKIISDSKSWETSEEGKESEWKKPKLPISAALKIGCSNFRYHPIRLLATILLSVIAFTLLGVSLNVSVNDDVGIYVNAIYDNKVEYTALYKYRTYRSGNEGISLDDFFGGSGLSRSKIDITRADMDLFRDVYNGDMAFIFEPKQGKWQDIYSFRKSMAVSLDQLNVAIKKSDKHFAISSNGYISLNLEYCEELGFNIVGELPKNSSEIAINECMLNSFMLEGLIEDGVTYPINRAEDVIGHKISISHKIMEDDYKTISGIVYTGCSKECVKMHPSESYHDKIFVSEDYFSSYSYVICTIDSNHKAFAKAVMDYDKDNTVFGFSNAISGKFYDATNVTPIYKTICLYFSIIFFVCAIILLINFIATSIRSQMKQIGILSSVGADFKQLIKVYLGSALSIGGIICLSVIPLTAIIVKVLNIIINNYIKNSLFNLISFNAIIIPILLVLVFATTILGSIIPLMNLRKISSIDMINKGQIK